MATKLLLGLLIFYVALCGLAFLFQGRLLFAVDAARRAGPPPPGAERLELAAADGTRLVGLRLAPVHPGPALPVVLGFGGNAWNADSAAEYLSDLYPEADIVTFHYRGYAPSGGRPGAEALLADALLVHDSVARLYPGRPVVAVGFSIGSGLAAHLAARRPLAGAILVTPFDSLAGVAAAQAPWLPVRLLWRNRIEPAADLRGANVPVAILAGGRDRLVPAARTDALRRAVPRLVYDRTLAGLGHNDIYRASAFQQAMREALRAIIRVPSRPKQG
ncbi:MAG: alpha/beta hydrolase [Alphaproteobacteria bacterium]|nr:alpha/beta hydrolase [Alphaproteobacteria bacterium]MBV9372077.1 alpha/beta hydrolase [Alphaproteobacteria bacterium]MBV9902431.1 alpha/beta hydrolase [Alphaproteobacteria bacterium]